MIRDGRRFFGLGRGSQDMVDKILIVEDSKAWAHALASYLTRELGHACDVAYNYAQAKDLLTERARDYFVALLDLNLPHAAHARSGLGSGLTALRAARARGDRTPVLVLSARDSTEERIAGLDAGADD